IQGPMFMSYAVAGHLPLRLTQVAGGMELSLRHRVLGMVEEGHREGVTHGWDYLLNGVKQLAE
ncbi:MAG: SRPBCC domain-containing protein, partial [Pirellulales bacterium]